jgi:mannan endo-1,6-alpha-mannosidase
MWETLMRNAQVTGDPRFVSTTIGALTNASFGPANNFLGPTYFRQLSANAMGLWNDDIMWWGMPAITLSELFTKDTALPAGGTFGILSTNTIDDIWSSWDTSTCGGGIFWTRDRNAASFSLRNYKSTISNVQYISMGARIYLLTSNQTYLDQAIMVYNWLTRIGLATKDGHVWDGADAPNCAEIFELPIPASYLYGQLIQGLAELYLATGKTSYLSDAELYTNQALITFTKDSILTDRCEPNCALNSVTPKGILLRGLATLYPLTSAAMKSRIKIVIDASFSAMLLTCNSKFACGNTWATSFPTIYSDFHTQLNAVELMNIVAIIYAPLEKPTKFIFLNQTASASISEPVATPKTAGADGFLSSSITSICLSLILSFFA